MRRTLVAGLLALAAREAAGQDVLEIPVLCTGQLITSIEVRARPPLEARQVPWYRMPIRLLADLHATTRPSVVMRYLVLGIGDRCLERRRLESERLLRTYPFFASARVGAYDDGNGGVKLIVVTVDELTMVADARFRGSRPTELTLGERNVGGTGTEIVARWRDAELRNGFGLAVTDHQFLGLPYELALIAERGDLGERRWLARASHAFLVEEQRRAWQVSASSSDQIFQFWRGSGLAEVDLGTTSRFADFGGVMRLGPPGRLSLFGISFSREEGGVTLLPRPDTTGEATSLLSRYEQRRNARINALWGFRALDFREMARVDALTATQDIARGVQVGLMFGRSMSVLATGDDDIFLAGDLYVGAGNGRTYVRLDARAEARENYDTNRWDGVLASGRVSLYQLTGAWHTLEVDAEWSGGWRQRVPFQLTLGARRAGVRGYRRADVAGGQRLVLRVEDRWLIDTFRDDADVAGAVFLDAGRLWAGDVPYGVRTPVRIGGGVGLLAAVPAGSRRTYRLELAFPFQHQAGARWEARLSATSVGLPLGWREPDDVARSRERAVPRSIF